MEAAQRVRLAVPGQGRRAVIERPPVQLAMRATISYLAWSGFINREAQACFLRDLIGRFRLERHEAVKGSLIRAAEGQAA